MIAQKNNGTTVVLEHRFFGQSNPIPNLEDESLMLLTIDQVLSFLLDQNVSLTYQQGNEGPVSLRTECGASTTER